MDPEIPPVRRPLRLGFILTDYFPYGGLQRDCLGVARLCGRRGHDCTIISRTWEGERPRDVRVRITGWKGWTNESRNRHFLRLLHDEILPQERFDRVIAFSRIPGVDVYFAADPCYEALVRRRKPFWFRWTPRYRHFRELEQALYRRGAGTRILLLTPAEIPHFRRLYDTEPERMEVLPPNIARWTFTEEDRRAARAAVRAEHGWAADTLLVSFVGSDYRRKGLARAVTAAAALPEPLRERVRLAVAGQDRVAPYAALARRLGAEENIRFLGACDDVRRLLLASDLLLHPAHSESAGLILLEATAVGLPVLVTDTCGYAFHIERAGNGIVLPSPFRQAALNAALREMLTSPQRPVWRENGLHYGRAENLYGGHARIADILEEGCAGGAGSPETEAARP